jgi:hypothetical protein
MPHVYLGQVVLWKHNKGSENPAPAIVTGTGQLAISVLIFPSGSHVGIPRDGVRHVSDPALATMVESNSGVWDYTEGDQPAISPKPQLAKGA